MFGVSMVFFSMQGTAGHLDKDRARSGNVARNRPVARKQALPGPTPGFGAECALPGAAGNQIKESEPPSHEAALPGPQGDDSNHRLSWPQAPWFDNKLTSQ
jgi:hypothetical protein